MPQDEETPTIASLFTRQTGAKARSAPRKAAEQEAEPQMGLLFAPGGSSTQVTTEAGETAGAPARTVWSVQELVNDVRGRVEMAYADVWVEGEISNLRSAPSGHVYFTLKDGEAQLAVVLFRRQATLLRFAPTDGMAVLVRGRVSVYESRGQLQLIAETAEPRGAGALQIAFEQLKAKLAAAGLFDTGRKRALPAFPRRIGVITAATGAVVHDIVTICQRRSKRLGIMIYPAAMQGESCAAEVMAGLEYFNAGADVDLIVIARGGGSAEDLSGFNHEMLAMAIAESKLPVVSAIGHETDFTIADFVADVRAATPSAAAELITDAQHRVEERVALTAARLGRAMRFQLMQARQQLNELSADAVFARMQESFSRRQQRADELRYAMEAALQKSVQRQAARLRWLGERLQRQDVRRRIAGARAEWREMTQRLAHAPQILLHVRRSMLRTTAARLQSLSPMAVLQRGYALVFDERGMLVHSAEQAPAETILTTRLAEGTLQSKVIKSTKKQ